MVYVKKKQKKLKDDSFEKVKQHKQIDQSTKRAYLMSWFILFTNLYMDPSKLGFGLNNGDMVILCKVQFINVL